MNTAASVAKLCEIKDVTEEDAKLIRDVWKAKGMDAAKALLTKANYTLHHLDTCNHTRSYKRGAIDIILRTSGVEHVGSKNGEAVYYCNAGDTYATTVIFIGGRLIVGCLGDMRKLR